MGWVVFFFGLVITPIVGWYLIRKRRVDLPLTLLGLVSLPVLIWAAALGAKIGPCEVDGCMSSAQHSRLVIAIVALGLLVVAFVLLALHQRMAGGIVLVVAELVGAFAIKRTDTASAVMLVIFAVAAGAYLATRYASERAATRVPDFPPAA